MHFFVTRINPSAIYNTLHYILMRLKYSNNTIVCYPSWMGWHRPCQNAPFILKHHSLYNWNYNNAMHELAMNIISFNIFVWQTIFLIIADDFYLMLNFMDDWLISVMYQYLNFNYGIDKKWTKQSKYWFFIIWF